MTYWLVNAGTTPDPLKRDPGAVRRAFKRWDDAQSPVHGLDRAYRMKAGDILVYRSVGTGVSRLVAFATVRSAPVQRTVEQWAYRVPRDITAVVPTLGDAAPFDVLGAPPIRVTMRLDDATGARAVENDHGLRERSARRPRLNTGVNPRCRHPVHEWAPARD